MAKVEVDPTAFASWEDAFQYPVASTRQFETQLRNHAEANKQKLRTIVGASYRDLLGTADRIVAMDVQMKSVDRGLGLVGQKTNARAIERIFENCARFDNQVQQQCWAENSFASQMAVLQRSILLVARFTRRKTAPLLCAKLLVLSRLLHKILSQTQPESTLLQTLQQRLASLRRRLLQLIDASLADPDAEVATLLDNMSAFALVNSASPSDILRHFHATRLRIMTKALSGSDSIQNSPIKTIQCLLQTVRQTLSIFPRRLSDSLAKLRQQTLLQQSDILTLQELELDTHRRWIAPELLNYTPWTRHDELQKPQADKQLKSWTQEAVRMLLRDFHQNLTHNSDFDSIVATRRAVFGALPASEKSLPGVDVDELVDQLRQMINETLVAIMKKTTTGVDVIADMLSTTAYEYGENASMWKGGWTETEISHGARVFRNRILQAFHGGDDRSEKIMAGYGLWLEGIRVHIAALKAMKSDRWDFDLLEDEDIGIDARKTLLNEDDPRELEDALAAELTKAFTRLQISIHSVIEQASTSATYSIQIASLLRIVRDISQRSIGTEHSRKFQQRPVFAASHLAKLHHRLVEHVCDPALAALQPRLNTFIAASTTLPARALWEGSPPLPAQPCTFSFRFLNELTRAMSAHGQDLWAAGATAALRAHLGTTLLPSLHAAAAHLISQEPAAQGDRVRNGTSTAHSDTTSPNNDDDDDAAHARALAHDKLRALAFDQHYLSHALSTPQDAAKPKPAVFAALDDAEYARLRKSAGEYWRRTYLLHAPLVA